MGKDRFLPVGNEMVSIPELSESDASIMGITFLHMGYKGMIEIRGRDSENPFLKPFIAINGKIEKFENIRWKRLNYWIPCFCADCGRLVIEGTYLPPIGERGFIISLKVLNTGMDEVKAEVGLTGCWARSIHEINENKEICAKKYVYESNWNQGLVFDLRNEINIFSFAPMFEEEMNVVFKQEQEGGDSISFRMSRTLALPAGGERVVNFYWGFGFEEVGAATAAKEMLRKGFEKEKEVTLKWLAERQRTTGDVKMDEIMNTNMFFNFFFASGITMDTEEFVLVTSRSPRYYVSAAYWDRDSLMWSFPSILLVDKEYAKNMLEYVFTRQIKNVGIHSRYIDGTVLEPGFELDELCAPVLALYKYVKSSNDYEYLEESHVLKGLNRILKLLLSKKHPEIDLYETFLQPTDDPIVYPYLTYNNVLVWKTFMCLHDLYGTGEALKLPISFLDEAEKVKKAIWENCVFIMDGKEIFAWSVDLRGRWNIYDEPPGSLQLLPFYGFCSPQEEVYRNTVEKIRDPGYKYSFSGCKIAEIGCEHAPHPWILSVANSLLCGRKDSSSEILKMSAMDNGIACESVDENTGECVTGEAFATCAGFLAYAIYYSFNENV